MKRSLLGALALAGALAACSGSMSPTGSDPAVVAASDSGSGWVRVIGTLHYCPICMTMAPQLMAAVVPGHASRGEPFSITVNTIGSKVCNIEEIKDAGTQVEVLDNLARIVAYDSVYLGPQPACPEAPTPMEVQHNATVRFDYAGEATVRIVDSVYSYTPSVGKYLDSLDFKVMVGP